MDTQPESLDLNLGQVVARGVLQTLGVTRREADFDAGSQPHDYAVALGIVSLCNHSRRPSARVRRNPAQGTLDLVALVAIVAGDEITIDYNCPLWFEAQD